MVAYQCIGYINRMEQDSILRRLYWSYSAILIIWLICAWFSCDHLFIGILLCESIGTLFIVDSSFIQATGLDGAIAIQEGGVNGGVWLIILNIYSYSCVVDQVPCGLIGSIRGKCTSATFSLIMFNYSIGGYYTSSYS